MPTNNQRPFPRSAANRSLKQAARKLERMSLVDRIQLLVKAKLITRADGDKAIVRLTNTPAAGD